MTRQLLLASLLAPLLCCLAIAPALANPCAPGEDDGISGTGISDERGMGGTGVQDEGGMGGTGVQDEGGMGGTGLQARGGEDDDDHGMGGTGARPQLLTGVFGTVTGFGSICVNGLEIEYDEATPVEHPGGRRSTSLLSIGQTVMVSAESDRTWLKAKRIELLPAVAGPVTEMGVGKSSMWVMAQPVRLQQNVGDELVDVVASLEVGDFVEVHGLRAMDGAVVASQMAKFDSSEPVSVSGMLERREEGGAVVGGTHVSAAVDADSPRPGFARVVGAWDADARRIVASRVDGLLTPGGVFARASVEAFALGSVEDGLVDTSVLPVDVSQLADTIEDLDAGDRLWVTGSIGEAGELVAEAIDVDPVGGGALVPIVDDLDDFDEEVVGGDVGEDDDGVDMDDDSDFGDDGDDMDDDSDLGDDTDDEIEDVDDLDDDVDDIDDDIDEDVDEDIEEDDDSDVGN